MDCPYTQRIHRWRIFCIDKQGGTDKLRLSVWNLLNVRRRPINKMNHDLNLTQNVDFVSFKPVSIFVILYYCIFV